MKKQFKLSFLGLSCACLVFMACEKKAVQNPAESPATGQPMSNENYAAKIKGANSSHWSDGWCRAPINNCVILDEIVIIKPRFDLIIKDAIIINTSTAVGDAFTTPDAAEIVSALPSDMVVALQSGNYYIAISNEDADKICYMVGQTNPVTADNLEFAFQVTKE